MSGFTAAPSLSMTEQEITMGLAAKHNGKQKKSEKNIYLLHKNDKIFTC